MATARVGLLKRAWNEVPDIVGSSVLGLVGVGMLGLSLYIYEKEDGDNRKYKMSYTVIRNDDPRAATVKSGPYVR